MKSQQPAAPTASTNGVTGPTMMDSDEYRQAHENTDIVFNHLEGLQAEITTLENKTLLGHDGMERVSQLRCALSVAQAREATIQQFAA